MENFRNLKAEDIEVRLQSSTDKQAIFLLYKDARCDMNILDETVGSLNWKREHIIKDGINYCRVSIYDETKQEWVFKEDCGSESNIEKDKGASSDAFKRACFNWGIGRELYTVPDIKVKLTEKDIFNGKCSLKLKVASITITNKKITALVLTDRFNNIRYTFGNNNVDNEVKRVEMFDEVTVDADLLYNDADPFMPTPPPKPTKTNSEILIDFCAKQKTVPNTDIDDLVRFYNFYKKKIGTWENTFNPVPLYQKWCKTKKSA